MTPVRYINVGLHETALPVGTHGPYLAVLVCERSVSDHQRTEIARALCETGCRYMMAWGQGGSLWDDAVDLANLEQFGFGVIPDASSVMTTWHDDESLEQVLSFAKRSAVHPHAELRETWLVHFGEASDGERILRQFAEA